MKERLESKMTPRLRASGEGSRRVFWKVIDGERILDRCWGVPIRRYSVFVGFTERRFEVSHEWVRSRVEVSSRSDAVMSFAENEMYSWVSSA